LAGDKGLLFFYTSGMNTSNLEYTSFLVRLWCESSDGNDTPPGGLGCLAQVEQIPQGNRRYFASLEDLFAFIRAQFPDPPQGGAPEMRIP